MNLTEAKCVVNRAQYCKVSLNYEWFVGGVSCVTILIIMMIIE